MLTAEYYTLDPEGVDPALYATEKYNYPMLYFTLLTYDGSIYEYVVRDSKSLNRDGAGSYPYLNHYTESGDSLSSLALMYDAYDIYALTDDPDVTWEELERGMVSSSVFDTVPFHMIYCDYSDRD